MHVPSVSAHAADLYTHSIYATLAKDKLSIKWEIYPGPMMVSSIWFEADTNKDDSVSALEAETWANSRVTLLTAALNDKPLPLQIDKLQFPTNKDAFQSGAEIITVYLSAVWTQNLGDSFKLVLHNGLEEQKSVNWYTITTQDGIKFQTPQQQNSIIHMNIFEPSAQVSAKHPLLSNWDTSVPSLQGPVSTTSALSNYIPNGKNTSQNILLNLVRQKDISVSFYLFALGISLLLGSLHALTPGHGKTVVAAYLVGSRGTSWHAAALGTVVTLTHTGSVFLLGIITLVASQYILPTSIIPILEILSGLLIVGLGVYLLWQRFQQWKKNKKYPPVSKYSLHPKSPLMKTPIGKYAIKEHLIHVHDHGNGHIHSHEIPETITWRSLIALGVSGGLVPCPDAIAILLVAIAINRIMLGLALIVAFSVGLAVVLIVIGLLMVNSRRLFDRTSLFDRFTPILPMASALVVIGLGVALTVGTTLQVKDNFKFTAAGSGSVKEAQIIYLAGTQDQVKQLFIANPAGGNPVLLSDAADNVVEYALSPDQSQAVYIVQTENLDNKIWLVDLKSGAKNKLLDCTNAQCSRPVWSPDGKRIVFEYANISANNLTGLGTLWWLDVDTGEAKPVFGEVNLSGWNPRWSPNGKWLSYVTSQDIRLYNLEAGGSHIIKTTLSTAADWSPDSRMILYKDTVNQNGHFVTQLFVYNLSSQTTKNITLDTPYENLFAAWSPDGEWVAAIRRDLSATQGDQIWLMHADGSEAHALTNTPDELHSNLNWSPDGKYLLYNVSSFNSSLESNVQMIAVGTGKVTSLGIQGYNAKWVWQ